MYLKNIKLAGFKSFADVTTIPIRSHMNAVVGPNGCGKSNVVDALRWVIGESSAKQLRGKSMADVIFNGTSARKPMGKAAIELLFDNTDGRISGEYGSFSEVGIRREIQRDGQSNYFINGVHCRRRDVVDIFLGTGLGPKSYAIIEQGMISRIIEAKPEEFRVYLEEAAGISKYKDRRRDTENRIRRTQENLERINDICEELTKQLRHLKRQSNAAERYKAYKEEERLLQAQIKALHWRSLDEQAARQDEKINAQTLLHEEQLANQRHLETDIEKCRIQQVDATETQAEVQKRYYSLGADIARIEQRIKDRQEQLQHWKTELEEAESLWQELTESSDEHQDQIQELTAELEELSPSSSDFQAAAAAAQEALGVADADMNAWQERWETFQKTSAESARHAEVARTNIRHYQQQLENIEKRHERIQSDISQEQLDVLHTEIQPIAEQLEGLETSLRAAKLFMEEMGQKLIDQRQKNVQANTALNSLQSELQTAEGRFASLNALQEAALAGDDQANQWLSQHALKDAPRLGRSLRVNAGWELAVETVMRAYFDAVCVDNITSFVEHMEQFKKGCLTLVDRSLISSSSSSIDHPTLSTQIDSDWPIQEWFSGVYITEDTASALALRDQLGAQESVITRDGLWLGANWARVVKPSDSEAGILSREYEIESLKEAIAEKQARVETEKAQLQEGRQCLEQLESERDAKQQEYQSVSAALTRAQAELSAKQSRHSELGQQQERLQKEIIHCQEQRQQAQTSLTQAQEQLAQSSDEVNNQSSQKTALLSERDCYRETLETARETAQRERQKADELHIRVASNESQLALLKQTVSRAARQMETLSERRETLKAQLMDTDSPLDGLNLELQDQLTKRVAIERELRIAEQALEEYTQGVRQLESQRNALQKTINDIKDQLQSIRMERQEITVRQTTIQEQLAETDCVLENILQEMPEEAEMNEWEQRSEKVAQRILRLGPINLAAIEEYQTINERKVYLDQQQADLHEALEILQSAIKKIDHETRSKFRETYEKVNAGFQELFPRIFGGGSACLELEEEDFLTSGVIVRAQPPGKRNTTIHMLSGGEKALTAVALVFALFQLNPAPFCVLDEVDAPLDDVNVGRFCQLVKEMSKSTQFIVISHNKVTIEMADYLMGVTMQEPGVSRLVSVDIEEAISMVDA